MLIRSCVFFVCGRGNNVPNRIKILLIIAQFCILITVLILVVIKSSNTHSGKVTPQLQLTFATELVNKGLYKEAAAEYETYLLQSKISDSHRAHALYIAADLYNEKLQNYEHALVLYLRLKNYYPTSTLMREANKKIVACLEHLGRSLDARLAVQEATALENQKVTAGATIIATVGSRKITETEFQQAMDELPQSMRNIVTTKKGRLTFLQQFIGHDLIYHAARRMGLHEDADIIRKVAAIRKELMVQRYAQKETAHTTPPDAGTLKMYYQAHKDRYKNADTGEVPPFTICRKQVMTDCAHDREQEAYSEMMRRMLQTEDVMIYDDLVK